MSSKTDPSSAENLYGQAQKHSSMFPDLLVEAQAVAATVAMGVHGRRRVGQGDAFWQFRPYETETDGRQRIDWRQSAKSEQLYVRQNEWEAAQTVWQWCDASASMRWRSKASLPSKYERSATLLLALAILLNGAGEFVGLLGQSQLAPAADKKACERLAYRLAQAIDQPQQPPSSGGFPAPVTHSGQALQRHAHCIWFGDFLRAPDDLARALGSYSDLGLSGTLVQVLDPAELSLPYSGRVQFSFERGEPDVLVPKVEAIRKEYIEHLKAHQQTIAQAAQAVGWHFCVHDTAEPPQMPLLSVYTALTRS